MASILVDWHYDPFGFDLDLFAQAGLLERRSDGSVPLIPAVGVWIPFYPLAMATRLDLHAHAHFKPRTGPLVVVIMDGVGEGRHDEGDAVWCAHTPTLDMLRERHLHQLLKAHGKAAGLPSDADMGNSEVGHNALGAGRVFAQGAKLVNEAIQTGRLWQGQTWQQLIGSLRERNGALHLIGLLSDGNVHSHINQLFALIDRADSEGVRRLFVHPLLDGRDVPETSALEYVGALEAHLAEFDGRDERRYRIASGGGRMFVTMDRYGADWSIVERGWQTHVRGEGRRFPSARVAVEAYRSEQPGISDQNLPPFVIGNEAGPVGPIVDGDGVVFFNFRGDRAIEISRAFEDKDFAHFDRSPRPDVFYAGMMQYDGDLKIPKRFLVEPPTIDRTMGEYLARNCIRQLAISETQKYGHVTYFWNGNRSGAFDPDWETYIEIPSDRISFDQTPRMKADAITDRLIEELRTGKYRFARVNYANGDMVGHTGVRAAAIEAVEAVDQNLGRLLEAVLGMDGVVLVTADHGNSDEMYEWDKKNKTFKLNSKTGKPAAKTSHTLNPVPFIIVDPRAPRDYCLAEVKGPGLANVAATALNLLGFEAPEGYSPSLIEPLG